MVSTEMPSIQSDHRQALFLAKREMSFSRRRRAVPILMIALLLTGQLLSANTAAAAYAIQVGAFSNPDNAVRFTDRISSAGFTVSTFPSHRVTDRLTHVVVGPFPDRATALTARKQLAASNWHGYLRSWPATSGSTRAGLGEPPGIVQPRLQDHTGDTGIVGKDQLIAEAPVVDTAADNDVLIIEDTPAGGGQDILIIEEEGGPGPIILDQPAIEIIEQPAADISTGKQVADIPSTDSAPQTERFRHRQGDFSIGLDNAWLEYGNFYRPQSSADSSSYGHLALSADWNPEPAWELLLGARVDWYGQTGDADFNEVKLDYTDSFVRYRGENYRLTAGTQKVIWGRIDELPPTDRISRADISRGILDPLSDRRRAMPVLRFEGFQDGYKLDAIWLPDFRRAALPDQDSVWYPINQTDGSILGFETTPLMKTFVQLGSISDSAPDGDGGFGVRLSNTGQQFDYAVTVQRVRQSTPYWQLNPTVREAFLAGNDPAGAIASSSEATFGARYPRTWVAGGDFGFEAMSATWRFEAAWISDTPVTRTNLLYDTVNSVNWAGGVQFYPGDRDVRVNLQLAAVNLIDASNVLDRTDIYNFNGSIFGEFGNNRWQSNTRFFIDLDEKGVYFNPEIRFVGWQPHEIYAAWHYFSGNAQTLGGYWKNNSLLTLGWRSRF